MGEWRTLTPGEAVARGLMPPGPLGVKKGADPQANEQAIRAQVNPEPQPTALLKQGTPEYNANLQQGLEDFKQAAGMTKEGRIPTSSILGAAVPSIVGTLVPSGRTVTRIGGNLLGNILGQAGAGAAGEMIDKPAGQRDVTGAALSGARAGVLPGLLQGGLGAILGPNKATIKTQKQIGDIRGAVSPEVAAVMPGKGKPATLLKSETPNKMGDAAGDLLDTMEKEVEKKLAGMKFRRMAPNGQLFPKGNENFIQMRDEIKRLREEANYNDHPLWGSKGAALKARKEANQLETAMLQQMPPDVARQYVDAMRAHRKNMDAVRYVRGLQENNAIEGKVNPYDNPGLGQAARHDPSKGPSASKVAHGALGAVEAVTGRPWGAAYNLSRAAGGKGPDKVAESVRGPLASRVPGVAVGTAATLGQDYVSRSTGD